MVRVEKMHKIELLVDHFCPPSIRPFVLPILSMDGRDTMPNSI